MLLLGIIIGAFAVGAYYENDKICAGAGVAFLLSMAWWGIYPVLHSHGILPLY